MTQVHVLNTDNINKTLESIFTTDHWKTRIHDIHEPLYVVQSNEINQFGLIEQSCFNMAASQHSLNIIGILPALSPERLGDPNFLKVHHIRFPYIVGEMANGIATAEMVIAAAKSGMLGFFGAAGLMPHVVEKNIRHIQQELQNISFGANLIYSPNEPQLEEAVANLYLQLNVNRVSASAYMKLSPHIVHYATKGLHLDAAGNICRRNYVFAKTSRFEVVKHFISPAPENMLNELVQQGKLTREEAQLAKHIPVAEDITIEADSGGHTDNRPLAALFPTIHRLAALTAQHYQYKTALRIGAAGGLGTPSSIASAFTLGAAYVLTGSINQSAIESGLSKTAKEMLLKADLTDVIMAPAADMFELGVKLQVLKRGSLFGMRALKLYELYTRYDSLESLPEIEKNKLETQIFSSSLDSIWKLTRDFFEKRDPQQIIRAEQNPKHRMALVFRWYLGLSSHWAIQGEINRQADYQIWCGPAMGAFNKWVDGSFLADLNARTVQQIGRNLLEGAVVILRAQQARCYGLPLPGNVFDFRPRIIN